MATDIDFEAEHRPDVARRASNAAIRRYIQKREREQASTEDTHAAAERGVGSPTTSLPFVDQIQASFGAAHDVSNIQAHVGGDSAAAMGANAFASGNHVVFDRSPDLHTAAHEAAHVVQQAQGVNLYGGVGEAGDSYERHADAVADRVVAGQSAADLLGHSPGGSSTTAIQKDEVQEPSEVKALREKGRLSTQSSFAAVVKLGAQRVSDARVALAAKTMTPEAVANVAKKEVQTVWTEFNGDIRDAMPDRHAVGEELEHFFGQVFNLKGDLEAAGKPGALGDATSKLSSLLEQTKSSGAIAEQKTKYEGALPGDVDKLTDGAITANAAALAEMDKVMDKSSSVEEARAILRRADANASAIESLCKDHPALIKKHHALLKQVVNTAWGLKTGAARYKELEGQTISLVQRTSAFPGYRAP